MSQPDPATVSSPFSMDNPVFKAFLGYAAVVLLKTLLMSFLTSYYRVTKKVFANEEDVKGFASDKLKVIMNNPDVERVRRAHLNDLENILPFILLGLLYTATSPPLSTALIHFRVFTAGRVLHSLVYVGKVPQPARFLCFMAAMLVNISLGVQVISKASF